MDGRDPRVERESKLAPGPDVELSDVARLVGPELVAEVLAPLDLAATYFDAPNLVLARAGITIRHRTGDGPPTWTVKLPRHFGASELTRLELDIAGPRNRRPREVGAAVAAHLRGRRLVPVADLHTIRSRVRVCDGAGRPLVEVAHDLVTASRGTHPLASWEEIEIEALDPYDGVEVQRRLTKALHKAGAKKVRPAPKLVRALGPEAAEPPEVAVPELGDHPSVADALQRALARSVDQILRHDPAVRIGTDPEDLHQLRVAVRRLRSDLRTFGRLLEPERTAHLRAELRWVADETSPLRDRDVLRSWLVDHRAAVPEEDAAGVAALVDRCDAEIATHRARLLRVLGSSRYLRLVHDLTELLEAPTAESSGKRAERAARDRLDRQVAKRWAALAARVDALGEDPAPADLHQARIAAKRARAAVEAVEPLEGRRARHLARSLAELQDVLGAVHDAAVFEAWLRSAGTFVAGELATCARAEATVAVAGWPEAWDGALRRQARRRAA